MRLPIQIGPFTVGEIPDPLEYQFLDANGAAMPISGYSATFTVRERYADTALIDIAAAVVTDAINGKVTYTWDGTELLDKGHYYAEFYIGNTIQRYASELISFDVHEPQGSIPAI